MNASAAIKTRIRAELRADGCTQKDLAWYLGLSEKHVSQVLTGRVTGSFDVIEAMASAVGLSLLPGGAR
jgi:transcriptional regulator with XRE-family HTH domain